MPLTSKSLKSAADYRKALITDLLTTQRVPKKFSWYEGFSWSTGKKAPVLVIGSLAKPLKAALKTGGAELKATGRCMLRGDSLCFETGSGSLSNTKLQAFLTAQQSGLAAENADFGAAEAGYEADDERSGSSSDSEEEDDRDEPSVPDEPPPDALQEEQERAAARQAEEERLRAEEEARQAEAERLRLEEEARLTAAAQAEAKERQPEVKKRVVRLRENATEAQKMVLLDIQTGLGEAWNGRQWRLVVERMNAADRTLDEIEAEIRTFLMAQAEAVDQFSKLCAAWAALKTAYTDEVLASLQQTWARQEDRSFAAHQELLAESSAQHRDFLSGRDKLKEQFGEISARRKALLLAANGEQKARLTEAYDAMMSRAKAGYLDDAFARLEDFRRLMEEVEDELEQERQLVVDNLQDLVEAAERTLESLDGGLIGMERDELAERLGLAREAAEQGKKATCEQALAALQEQLDRATGQQVLAEELMVRRSTYPARVEAAEEHAEGHTGLVAAIHRVWENADQAPTEQDWDGLQKALDTLDTLLETLRALKEGEAKDEEAARQQAEAKKQAEQAQKAAAQAAKAAQRQAEVADGMSWGDAYFAGQSALLQKIWGETKKVAGTNNTLGGIPGKYPIDVIRDAIAVWDGTSPNRPGLTGMHVPGKDVQDKSRKMKAGGQNAGRKGSEGCFISTWHGVNYNIHVKVAGT